MRRMGADWIVRRSRNAGDVIQPTRKRWQQKLGDKPDEAPPAKVARTEGKAADAMQARRSMTKRSRDVALAVAHPLTCPLR